jgi:hypothetical protein
MMGVRIKDVPWGYYEDTECANPCAKYAVQYLSSTGSVIVSIDDKYVHRALKPFEICKITFRFHTRDGFAWKNRIITLDEVARSEGRYSKRLVTNGRGFANAFLMPGTRVRILPDGEATALDVAIPDKREITWTELLKYGSKADVDPRFSIGTF